MKIQPSVVTEPMVPLLEAPSCPFGDWARKRATGPDAAGARVAAPASRASRSRVPSAGVSVVGFGSGMNVTE